MVTNTVLITGSNGFIGSSLLARFGKLGKTVALDCGPVDMTGLAAHYVSMRLPHPGIKQVMAHFKPRTIVHCAGTASVPQAIAHPDADFRSGPETVFQLLDAIRQSGIETTFIFPSSAAVYGNPRQLPIEEDAATAPISPYGYHKLICEKIIEEHQQLYNISAVILRIFSCYGEGLQKQLLWDLCRKMHTGKLDLFGTGEETRDFVHIRDLVSVIELVTERTEKNLILNVASGRQSSIRQVVDLVLRAFGSDVQPIFNNIARAGDPTHWAADITRLTELGFRAEVTLPDGISQYVRWFKKAHAPA